MKNLIKISISSILLLVVSLLLQGDKDTGSTLIEHVHADIPGGGGGGGAGSTGPGSCDGSSGCGY